MTYQEEALQFQSSDETLLGLIARPEVVKSTGVLILVGGPQYRVGSHRQFVLLARRLAAEGFATMRFDFAGMGDSTGEFPGFEHVGGDIAAAISAFQGACPSVSGVVLWGLCDAASAALLYCADRKDPRVTGLCLLNPWVRSEMTLAQTHIKHYYLQRLGQRDFWIKLLRGGLDFGRSLTALGQSLRKAFAPSAPPKGPQTTSFQQRMSGEMRRFPGDILLILAGDDLTAKEFDQTASGSPAWADVLARPNLACHRIVGADHTFSSSVWRDEVEGAVLKWLNGLSC